VTLSARASKKLLYDLTKTWRPLHYQGGNQKSRYFEGWYFKNVSADGDHIWSVIPGISIVEKSNRHSFIQLINGKTAETWYIEYPLEDFSYSKLDFEFSIGDNKFGYSGMNLDIDDPEITATGNISFSNLNKLKSTLLNPGIMGWYSFVPFMECYHGLVSADHDLNGSLAINNNTIDFSGGKGYSEKDWGRSMPSSWIWMQSNHFEIEGTSVMLSIARIPWMLSSFTGFLCVLLLDGKIYRFATYTGAKIKRLRVSDESVTAEIADKQYTLTINARHSGRGILVAPLNGAMDRRIAESVDAIIELRVTDKKGKKIFSGKGINAGLELVGDRSELPV
jgi:tocopherol cyclase